MVVQYSYEISLGNITAEIIRRCHPAIFKDMAVKKKMY